MGYLTLTANTTGTLNTAFGAQAMQSCTTGIRNTAVGHYASGALTTGNHTTAVGTYAGDSLTTGEKAICIGYNAQSSTATVSNQCTFGDSSIDNLRCADTSISTLSDERDKTNIVDIPLGLSFLNTVRPVAFDWDARDGSRVGKKDFGFIAQELKIAADATDYADHLRVVHEENPDMLEADSMKMFPVLVKAIQELSAKNEALLARIVTLEG